MDSETTRSEQVVEDYKKRKLARSAIHRIHEIIQGFEQGRREDRRLAWIGIAAIVLLLAAAAMIYLNAGSVNLS